MRVRAIRRIVTPVKGAVVEAGEVGTLDGDAVRWDSMPFAAHPGVAEGVDYEIIPDADSKPGRARVRALVPVGTKHKGGIVQPGTLGWRDANGVAFDCLPWAFIGHLMEGVEYEVVAGDTPAPTSNFGAVAVRVRERELLAHAAPIKELMDRCCEIAAAGGDFLLPWEEFQVSSAGFLGALQRVKGLPRPQ